MSLVAVLQTVPSEDPCGDLLAAMQEFESALTREQKDQLRLYDNVPHVSAVTEMTVLIDEAQNNRRSNCVGVRLYSFLESVQQFSSVIETFVSSNPAIAALIWGGVKLAMLVANKDSAYFDRVSTMVMQIRTLCPYYSQYGSLYKDSIGLQRALCNYFAAVVRLCKKVVEFSQNSGTSRFVSLLFNTFEREFGPSCAALDRLGKIVSEEVKIASEVARRKQQDEDEKYRNHGYRFREALNLERREAQAYRNKMLLRMKKTQRKQFLDRLSKYSHKDAWRQARKKCFSGTCLWFKDCPEFHAWVEKGSSSVLWISGIVGSGKTVLNAGIIAHLETLKPQDETVAYYFCQYDNLESRQARTIIGSIARQLISSCLENSGGGNCGFERFLNHESYDIDLISVSVTSILSKSRNYYIVLDGIDDCEKEERNLVFDFLKFVLSDSTLTWKILCSTRPVLDEIITRCLQPEYEIKLSRDITKHDIDRFIESSVEQKLEDHKLQVGSLELISEIKDVLRAKAEGMFLWVVFQIEDICAQETDAEIRQMLQNIPLPQDLPATFRRLLKRFSRSKENEKQRTIRIFRWLIAAKRPLTVCELREAVAIEPYQTSFEADRLPNNIFRTLSVCGSLVILEEEGQTVHFAHHSVRDFILSRANDEEKQASTHLYHNSSSDAETEASSICLTYLNLSDFNRQIARQSEAGSMSQASTSLQVPIPSQLVTVNRIALKILGHRQTRSHQHFNALRALQDVAGATASSRGWDETTYCFLSYASKYWLEHIRCVIPPVSCKLFSQFVVTLETKSDIAEMPWTMSEWNVCSNVVLKWIVQNNDLTVLRALLMKKTRPSIDTILDVVDLVVSNCRYDLWDVLMENSIGIQSYAKFLSDLKNGKDEEFYDKIAQILSVHSSFKPQPESRKDRFNLHDLRPFRVWSALRGSHCLLMPTKLSKLPFDGFALPNLESLDSESRVKCRSFIEDYEKRWHALSSKPWSALDLAITRDSISIVESLLHTRTFISFPKKKSSREPALFMAVLGKTDMLTYCLRYTNIDLQCTTVDGFTPLMIMTARSSEYAVKALITSGVDILARSDSGWDALMIAGAMESKLVANLLFSAIVQANPDTTLDSLMMSTSLSSNLIVVENHRVSILEQDKARQNLIQWYPDGSPTQNFDFSSAATNIKAGYISEIHTGLNEIINDDSRKTDPRYHPWHDSYFLADPAFAKIDGQ